MDVFDLSKFRLPKKENVTVVSGDSPLTGGRDKPIQVEIVHTRQLSTFFNEVFIWLLGAWLIMISFGVLHVHHPAVPLLSYWDGFFGLLILGVISENIRSVKKFVDKE